MNDIPPFISAPNLNDISSSAFKLRHGFFSKIGGVSKDHFLSLNTGPGSCDDALNVSANRKRCAHALALPGQPVPRLLSPYQIHSDQVITIDAEEAKNLWEKHTLPKADAIVTNQHNLIISILTADCMPFLFADAGAKIIGAAHAGWRGALNGILEKTIDAMVALGATPRNIKASLGPCLRLNNFEVGMDLVSAFLEKDQANKQFFYPGKNDEKRQFDLAAFGFSRLESMEVVDMYDTNICTLSAYDQYFSYRYSKQINAPDYGRNLSAIVI